jgi:hypothetical protein
MACSRVKFTFTFVTTQYITITMLYMMPTALSVCTTNQCLRLLVQLQRMIMPILQCCMLSVYQALLYEKAIKIHLFSAAQNLFNKIPKLFYQK